MLADGLSLEFEWQQVSRTLLRILAVLNNAIVWMVSARPPTSKSSSPFCNPFVTVPKAPITIGIIVTFMFHIFFYSLGISRYLSLFSLYFSFILWSTAQKSQQFCNFSVLCWLLSGMVFWPRLDDPFVCQSLIEVYVCHILGSDAGLCMYHLFVWSNFNFLYISQWITLPTQSRLVLYSFRTNLLHSLIMWLMVSSLSPQSLHLLFCCVLSILALIWLVLMALFCADIRRGSVSLLKFPFLSHNRVFSCEMLILLLLLLLLFLIL